MYQQHLNESLSAQRRSDRLDQAAAERDLRAMRLEERSLAEAQRAERAMARKPNGKFRRALSYLGALATFRL